MQIPSELTVGLAGKEQELPGSELAGLDPTGVCIVCNHMHGFAKNLKMDIIYERNMHLNTINMQ